MMMKTLIFFVLWCILLVLCWPLAILAIVLFPVFWLIALPFRMTAVVVQAFFVTLKTILFLPARILGYRSHA